MPARLLPARPGFVGVDGEILQFWQVCKLLSQHRIASLRDVFVRMRLVLQLQRRKRELQAAVRARKRRQLLETLQLAETASKTGDSRTLYQCVRWLAPNNIKRTIRLRDEQGLLLHPKDECKLLADYAEDLFRARRSTDIPQVTLSPLDPSLFSPALWVSAIRCLKVGKAVPTGQPSVQQWRDCAHQVAERLSQVAIDALCCSDPKVPTEWSTVQLAWLAKAGKTPSRPQNLRSIGLMSVDSKAFLIVLRSALAPYVEQAMHGHPQYAYRKGASTADALMRAAGHCSAVRMLLQRHRHDQTSRLLGEAVVPCVGGLMCGLDLQKAFDALPHSELHDAMIEAGVPEPLAATITQVHVQTRCAIMHGGTEREVCMSRGLRQGCPIAPLLYAAWSCRFCKLLDKRLSASWTSSHCTLFADDIFSSWVIRSVKEFHAAVRELRALIEALCLLGMSVNFQKSVVVLRLCGKAVERLSKSYLVWRSGVQHLRVRCTDNDIYIPCATQMPYLGAELSYDNFELKTFKGREKQATARFQELRRVLRTNGSITTRHRLRIYKAIVWPTLWYALSSVGITTEVLRGVCSVLAGHLRKVLRVYQEGVTNKMILQQAGLDPREFFLGQVQKKGLCIQRDPRRAEHVKAPQSRYCQHLHQRLLGLEDNPNMTSLVRIPKVDAVAVVCPCCGITYDSQASLQMHIKHQHSEINQSARLAFHRDLHALHGLPICRFCQARLHDWRSLEKHITEGTCPKVKVYVSQGLDADAMLRRVREDEQLQAPPVPQKATPQSQLEQDIGEALKFEPSTLNSCGAKLLILATRCALCRQLIPGSKIKIHWQRTHAPEWKKYSATAISGSKSLCSVFSTPCRFCGSQAKNSRDHSAKCSSLFQLLAVRAMRSAGSTAPMPAKGPAPKQSERSPLYAQFDITKTGLGKYLRKAGDQEAGGDAQKASTPGFPSSTKPVVISDRSAAMLAPPAVAPLPQTWLQRLVLGNPHNHCYMNASMYAVLHVLQDCPSLATRAMQSLRGVCQGSVRRGGHVVLSAQLIVRSILRTWTFDRRQHDAAEFTAALLHGLGLSLAQWEARYPDQEGVQVLHTGGAPVSLRMRATSCGLQDLVDDWHQQVYMHAFVVQDEPVLLHLARNADASKNEALISIASFVWLPIFTEGIIARWHSYQVRALVEHHGDSVVSGHYRSVLKFASGWMHTDDGVMPTPVLWTQAREQHMYLVWLVPAQSLESRPSLD